MASINDIDVSEAIKRLSGEAAALLQLLADGTYGQEHDSSVSHYLVGIEHLLAHPDLADGLAPTENTILALNALLSAHQQLLKILVEQKNNLGSQLADFHRKSAAIRNYAMRPGTPVSITGKRKG